MFKFDYYSIKNNKNLPLARYLEFETSLYSALDLELT